MLIQTKVSKMTDFQQRVDALAEASEHANGDVFDLLRIAKWLVGEPDEEYVAYGSTELTESQIKSAVFDVSEVSNALYEQLVNAFDVAGTNWPTFVKLEDVFASVPPNDLRAVADLWEDEYSGIAQTLGNALRKVADLLEYS